MPNALALVTILTDDYDRAIDWFQRCLGFVLLEDTDEGRKRWVRMAPAPSSETTFVIAKASTPEQEAVIGKQTGDRVGFFLRTNDFRTQHCRMIAQGVRFKESPRRETYGTVAVFEDLHGNLWDLIEPA